MGANRRFLEERSYLPRRLLAWINKARMSVVSECVKAATCGKETNNMAVSTHTDEAIQADVLPFDVFELLFNLLPADGSRTYRGVKNRHPLLGDIPKIVRHFRK